ncbi:MAG: hypothetical protein R2781_09615 [Flavobacteriaceae bacterium]
MFSKSNLISTLVTAVWGYLGGWLLWGMLVDPILETHVVTSGLYRTEETMDMIHLIIGCLIVGLAISTLYSKWGSGRYSPSSGLGFGAWIGILVGFGVGIVNYSVMNLLDITGTLIDGATYVVFFAIMGFLAGLVYQKTSPKA